MFHIIFANPIKTHSKQHHPNQKDLFDKWFNELTKQDSIAELMIWEQQSPPS